MNTTAKEQALEEVNSLTLSLDDEQTDTTREEQFMEWEGQYGTEEAIEIAAEEWGLSTYRVKQQIIKWEDAWH
jgi:hypothetical protein